LKSAQRADSVVFESEYTQNFFIEKYNIQASKSSVINIGKDNFFLSDINVNVSSFHASSPFVLCVSHLYPYKQIPEMIEAFCSINRENDFKYTLMIAGSKVSDSYYRKILTMIDKNDANDSVKLLGAVSKEDLYFLYSECELMLFPSPCENFAYTLVEAMSRGAPIVCSNTTAMPETCGDAAVYFDPFDIDDMKKSIRLVLSDKNLENKLRDNSLKRVIQLPSYEEATTRTIDIMKRIVNE
jgi:glycosyltransferase involved in cell wall biosynthesis